MAFQEDVKVVKGSELCGGLWGVRHDRQILLGQTRSSCGANFERP